MSNKNHAQVLLNEIINLKKIIEKSEGDEIIDGEYVVLCSDDLRDIMGSCSALLQLYDIDLNTKEIMGG